MPQSRRGNPDSGGSSRERVERRPLDSKGQPVPVYHGTSVSEDFDAFVFGGKEQAFKNGLGVLGPSFSESREVAETYVGERIVGPNPRVIEAHLRITNPKRYTSINAVIQDARRITGPLIENPEGCIPRTYDLVLFRQELLKQGYDGITFPEGPIYKPTADKAATWIPFSAEQIQIIAKYPVTTAIRP